MKLRGRRYLPLGDKDQELIPQPVAERVALSSIVMTRFVNSRLSGSFFFLERSTPLKISLLIGNGSYYIFDKLTGKWVFVKQEERGGVGKK